MYVQEIRSDVGYFLMDIKNRDGSYVSEMNEKKALKTIEIS